MKLITLLIVVIYACNCLCVTEEAIATNEIPRDEQGQKSVECRIDEEVKREILGYKPVVDKIVDAVTKGDFKGKVYDELAAFVDKFGSRYSGTKNLEDAIDYMQSVLKNHNLDNVHTEPVTFDGWFRGEEYATLIKPRLYEMKILGLGNSISTPGSGIVAEALVVNSFEELVAKSDQVKGKIVVYNEAFKSYGETVKYRSIGAIEAARHGAVAALLRSVTPYSLYTPHTGMMHYDPNVTRIPFAAITIEDAQMLRRMSERGSRLEIELKMSNSVEQGLKSRNSVAELAGRKLADRVVLVSGHLDSWDVGQGAMDDGAGAFISWYSLAVLNKLGLRPKRTLRAVLWTVEELGLIGAKQYVKRHYKDLDKFDLVMESDEGTFTPLGMEFAGSENAECVVQEILKLMDSINATKFQRGNKMGIGSDIVEMTSLGVPGASLLNQNDKYFYYHHTNADTMTVEDPDSLDKCLALWAAFSYVVADLNKNFKDF
uniref:Carboxypeptidase Q n=1 Tax=Nilaparvata lugens TaxID=108931 RepID=A0A1I9WL52_NILLU|nr:seminal fluid protein [Nilaparvata lugens]